MELSPEDRERLTKSRLQTLQLFRFVGLVLMLLGMLVWASDVLREGGLPELGIPVFALGAFNSLIVPILLARRWRTPPEA
ncbi:MAG: hypothetical protein RLN87_02160 [Parasphingopyxis sp.]|uniref:hypothetical protein n=1 Tax=Parasphingopyxis sp. TaxID=1920299 RepID=UPI0032EE5D18